jgi:hypothetical protein
MADVIGVNFLGTASASWPSPDLIRGSPAIHAVMPGNHFLPWEPTEATAASQAASVQRSARRIAWMAGWTPAMTSDRLPDFTQVICVYSKSLIEQAKFKECNPPPVLAQNRALAGGRRAPEPDSGGRTDGVAELQKKAPKRLKTLSRAQNRTPPRDPQDEAGLGLP